MRSSIDVDHGSSPKAIGGGEQDRIRKIFGLTDPTCRKPGPEGYRLKRRRGPR
jgi:hypothetical protein